MIPKKWLLPAFVSIIVILAVVFNTYYYISAVPEIEVIEPELHTAQTFYNYLICLAASLALACLRAFLLSLNTSHKKRYKQKSPIQQHLHYYLNYEWQVFQLYTFTLLKVFKIGTMIALNIYFLYFRTTDTDAYTLSLVSAQLAITNIAFSVLLSAKHSFIQRYIFSFNDTIAWHAWFSRIGFIEALYHATFHLQPHHHGHDDTAESIESTIPASFVASTMFSVRSVTGIILLLSLSSLMFGSHPLIRKYISYPFFRISHLLSFFAIILFGILHHELFLIFYISVALFWIVDHVQRFDRTEVVHLDVLPNQIVKLTCQRPAAARIIVPCQFMLVSFHTSWWKGLIFAHPFSISNVESDQLAFHIKCKGKQTSKLLQAVSAIRKDTDELNTVTEGGTLSRSSGGMRQIRISRPLGKPKSRDFTHYEHVCLIAEGMGITPWLSLLQFYSRMLEYDGKSTKSIEVIWSIHSIDTFAAFEEELQRYLHAFNSSDVTLRISIFVTGSCDDLEKQTESLSIPNREAKSQYILFNYGRPHYQKLLSVPSEINEVQPDLTNYRLAIGICAHATTMAQVNNIALNYSWPIIQKERFNF